MIYGVILAGGSGTRMGNVEKAKPFLMLGSKPIIIHTVEKFYVNDTFEKILVLCPAKWMSHAKDLMKKYISDSDRVVVIEGGSTRNETIMNAIAFIEEKDGLDEETIIVTHDSVRPFVTSRIIEENIQCVTTKGACDTVIPATDTIVEGQDGQQISSIPDRSMMYQGQTPQSFPAKRLKDLYYALSEEEKTILTDAAKIFIMKGEPVYLVQGETFNFKITFPYDLRLAEALVEEDTNA